MTSNADNMRRRLRDSIDASKERREIFLATLDHSSLEKLALSAAAQKRSDDEQAAIERAKHQEQLQVQWTSLYIEQMSPFLTRHFAKEFEIPEDSPLLAELRWRFDPSSLTALRFEENEGGVKAIGISPDSKFPRLQADIGAATIQATTLTVDGEITGARFAAIHSGGSAGISDLEGLGREIENAQERLNRAAREGDQP